MSLWTAITKNILNLKDWSVIFQHCPTICSTIFYLVTGIRPASHGRLIQCATFTDFTTDFVGGPNKIPLLIFLIERWLWTHLKCDLYKPKVYFRTPTYNSNTSRTLLEHSAKEGPLHQITKIKWQCQVVNCYRKPITIPTACWTVANVPLIQNWYRCEPLTIRK